MKDLSSTQMLLMTSFKFIQLDPTSTFIYKDIGRCYANLNQYEKAIENYTKAIKLDLEDELVHETHLRRGFCYMQLKQYEQAVIDFSKAIELNPTYTFAYDFRGDCYKELGQFDKAIENYAKAMELDPDNSEEYRESIDSCKPNNNDNIKSAEEYFYTGANSGLAGEFEKAVHYYNEAIKTRPQQQSLL